LKINIPRKITKTIRIDDVDEWARKRFSELCVRYDLGGTFPEGSSKKRKKKELEGCEFIASFQTMDHGILSQKISEDRHIDRLRLMVRCQKISPATKFIANLLKTLPLAIHTVYLMYEDQSPEIIPEESHEDTRDWYSYIADSINLIENEPVRNIMKEYMTKFT